MGNKLANEYQTDIEQKNESYFFGEHYRYARGKGAKSTYGGVPNTRECVKNYHDDVDSYYGRGDNRYKKFGKIYNRK